MKIMIIGDSATGKSTFALALGKKLSIPVIHIDQINDSIGREKRNEIRERIEAEIKEESWIFDGNGLTKDKDARLKNTDILFVFNSNPFLTLYRQIARYTRIKSGKEKRVGSESAALNLQYFIPYIFLKFPQRKRDAIHLAQLLGKKVYIVNTKKDIRDLLIKIDTDPSFLRTHG